MSQSIFRERAVKAYQDPDSRGSLLRLAPPSIVWLLGALAALTVLAIVTAALTRVRVVASGRGILRPREGIVILRAAEAGSIGAVQVALGQQLEAGAVLLTMERPVLAPVGGVVDALPVHSGERVAAGTALVKLVPNRGARAGFLAIPARFRSQLRVGQTVRLRFDEEGSAGGMLRQGRIARVSADVLTPELASAYLAEHRDTDPPSFLVEVALEDATAASLLNGMPFEGQVILREQRALTLLFAPLASLLGD